MNKFLDFYFKPKSFEKNGKIYKILGIKTFKRRFIRPTPQECIPDHSVESLKKYEEETRLFEKFHLKGFAAISGVSLVYFILGFFFFLIYNDTSFFITFAGLAGLGCVLNLLVNIYPIILQRYNRIKIYKVLEKKKAKLKNKTKSS